MTSRQCALYSRDGNEHVDAPHTGVVCIGDAGGLDLGVDDRARSLGEDDRPSVLQIVFFFQAEDGIRDVAVTGVQTCALPISFRGFQSVGNSPTLARAKSSSVMHWSAVAGVVCVGACAARGTTPRASSSRARRATRVLIAPGATSGGRGCPRPRRAGRSSGTRGRSRTPAYRAA